MANVLSLVLKVKPVFFFLFLVTNPVDVIKTRLQLDNELSSKAQKRYNGFVRGLGRIVAEEGLRGLYKG